MKINVISSVDRRPSGVNRAMMEFANYLCTHSHETTVIKAINRGCPGSRIEKIQFALREFGYLISGRRVRTVTKLPWVEVKCPVVTIPSFNEKYIPAAGVTLFSFEYLLPAVEKLPAVKGKKVMRVCNIFFAERVKEIPPDVFLIANSSLVKNILEKKLQRRIFLLVNGVNTGTFNNPDKQPGKPKTVGMFFYNRRPAHKGMEDGFRVMEKLHGLYKDLEFQVAGEWKESYLPRFVKFHDATKIENLVNFYRTTDIFIYTSRADACPNPPMEAMACKCALVTTATGGIDDYTSAGKTAFVCPPGDVEAIFNSVRCLVEDEVLYRKTVAAGFEKIQDFSTEEQGKKLESILLSILEKP